MDKYTTKYIFDFENCKIYDDSNNIINKNESKPIIKLSIVGSRSLNKEKELSYRIFDCFSFMFGYPKLIISGGAIGPDLFGEEWARNNGINVKIFKPDWVKYGKKAGFIRNEDIIKNSDVCLAIWDGESHGTKNDFDWCKKYNKELLIFNYKEYKEGTFSGLYYYNYENSKPDIFIENKSKKKIIYKKNNRWLPQEGVISI